MRGKRAKELRKLYMWLKEREVKYLIVAMGAILIGLATSPLEPLGRILGLLGAILIFIGGSIEPNLF